MISPANTRAVNPPLARVHQGQLRLKFSKFFPHLETRTMIGY